MAVFIWAPADQKWIVSMRSHSKRAEGGVLRPFRSEGARERAAHQVSRSAAVSAVRCSFLLETECDLLQQHMKKNRGRRHNSATTADTAVVCLQSGREENHDGYSFGESSSFLL